MNQNIFTIELNNIHYVIKTKNKKYNLKKRSIDILHIFDNMCDENMDINVIICPDIFDFENIFEKVMRYCDIYYYTTIINDKKFHDIFNRWSYTYIFKINVNMLNECAKLCKFLNCDILLNLIINIIQDKNNNIIDNEFISDDELINKISTMTI